MGQFQVTITAIGPDGCDRRSQPGEKLHNRCGKFGCPDCMSYDFVQQMRQKGFTIATAQISHNHGRKDHEVIDDLLRNERKSGLF